MRVHPETGELWVGDNGDDSWETLRLVRKGSNHGWSDFEGKYRVLYFGYAYCPDVCPLDVQRMMQGYARFKEDKPELAAQVNAKGRLAVNPRKNVLLTSSFTGYANYMRPIGQLMGDAEAMKKFVSGVILYEETLFQSSLAGQPHAAADRKIGRR